MNSEPLSMRNALGIPCSAISFSNTAQTFSETKLVSTSMVSTSVQYSSFHRLKIPHFSGAVVSLLLLSDGASEGRFHVLRAFVAVLPFGVPSSCSCLLGC